MIFENIPPGLRVAAVGALGRSRVTHRVSRSSCGQSPRSRRAVSRQDRIHGTRPSRPPPPLVSGDPRQGTCPGQIAAGQAGRAAPRRAGAGHGRRHGGRARWPPAGGGRHRGHRRRRRPGPSCGGLGAVVIAGRARGRPERGAGLRRRAMRPPGGRTGAGPALPADLPALRPAELAARAGPRPPRRARRSCPDAAGTGTTLYAAGPGAAFGPRSAPARGTGTAAAGAAELDLPGLGGLRQDVDTPADLRRAAALGARPADRGGAAACPRPVGAAAPGLRCGRSGRSACG